MHKSSNFHILAIRSNNLVGSPIVLLVTLSCITTAGIEENVFQIEENVFQIKERPFTQKFK